MQMEKAKRFVHEPSHKTLESVDIIGYDQGNAGDKSSRGGLLTPIGEIASFSMFYGRPHGRNKLASVGLMHGSNHVHLAGAPHPLRPLRVDRNAWENFLSQRLPIASNSSGMKASSWQVPKSLSPKDRPHLWHSSTAQGAPTAFSHHRCPGK